MDFNRFKAINDGKINLRVMDSPSIVKTFKNESCGDDYVIYLRIEGGIIQDATFTTTGCGFGLAALSLATEWVRGKSLEEAERITVQDIERGIDGFPERRGHYPKVAAWLMRKAIQEYRERQHVAV